MKYLCSFAALLLIVLSSPLSGYSQKKGENETVTYELSNGNPNETDSTKLALLAATAQFINELAKKSPVDIKKLKEYLDHGADIHAVDLHHWSLLHEAAFQGDTGLIRRCLANKLDVNLVSTYDYFRHSVLYYAIKNNHPTAAKMLRDNGAVLCIPDGYAEQEFGKAKYKGNFLNEEKTGKGIITYSNGNSYDGDWKNDEPNGYGTFYWADGKRYEGAIG